VFSKSKCNPEPVIIRHGTPDTCQYVGLQTEGESGKTAWGAASNVTGYLTDNLEESVGRWRWLYPRSESRDSDDRSSVTGQGSSGRCLPEINAYRVSSLDVKLNILFYLVLNCGVYRVYIHAPQTSAWHRGLSSGQHYFHQFSRPLCTYIQQVVAWLEHKATLDTHN
jgi:hypothetical protein